MDQLGQFPGRNGLNLTREPPDLIQRPNCGSARPCVLRVPADWWNAPSAVGCQLSRGPLAARDARRLTRKTLCDWGLTSLAGDAEIIVGELVANAVTHGVPSPDFNRDRDHLSLRLLRRSGEVICAVLDPSDVTPMLKTPDEAEETGRGLQIVDALSDVWGWSPASRGKVVWAIFQRTTAAF